MPADSADIFVDNWAYLKAELHWLERVLMLAVARQRKESKEVDRIAQSKADRATSHWWKGVIALEGNAAYDEHRQPGQAASLKVNYQQQIETRIQGSRQRGVVLGLPALCDRLQLTLFEKNLLLMSLAPEVNRRYARLYRYLQEDASLNTDLPTLDLVLRLLCRNDVEWRTARNRLLSNSPLVRHGLVQLLPCPTDSNLNRALKLAEPLTNYLLAEQPTPEALDALLYHPVNSCSTLLQSTIAPVSWSDLVLPAPLLADLQFLAQQVTGAVAAAQIWELTDFGNAGAIVLLSGKSGTGKTSAAGALAHALATPLTQVDLAGIEPDDYVRLMQEMIDRAPTVLLIQSAQNWLGRSSLVSSARLHQLLAQRRSLPAVTLFSTESQSIAHTWHQQFDRVLEFSLPDRDDRLRLWQRAFPPEVPVAELDWEALATQLDLTGGDIVAIAQSAVRCAAALANPKVEMEHVVAVLAQRQIAFKAKSSKSRSAKKPKP